MTGTVDGVRNVWTVTADVAAFVAGTQTNNGWRLKDQTEGSGGGAESEYFSREEGAPQDEPQLIVFYADTAPPPPTFDSVEMWVLNEAGIAAASDSTFVPTWSSAPANVSYAHAFYENVNQAALTGAQASNSSNAATPNPITTAALANTNGGMVVVGAVSGNSGAYTAQNGFSLGLSTSFGSTATLGTAEKSGTGAAETPSMQHDAPNRQAIAAFVLQVAP